jgi:hypothetical protein
LYGQYIEAIKQFETACKVIIYGHLVNKVVISNQEGRRQHVCYAQKHVLQDWMESHFLIVVLVMIVTGTTKGMVVEPL